MLSEEEKDKIELVERYRNEIVGKLKSKTSSDRIEHAIKILQGIAIIGGIAGTYIAYKQQNENKELQEKQSIAQTAKEFRKGFYDKQFLFYTEALEATSTLATEKIFSEEYSLAKKKFYRLFWGRLSMVEDKTVEMHMMKFSRLLSSYEQPNPEISQSDLQQSSLDLAHAARLYTLNVWLDSVERKNYNPY